MGSFLERGIQKVMVCGALSQKRAPALVKSGFVGAKGDPLARNWPAFLRLEGHGLWGNTAPPPAKRHFDPTDHDF